MISLIIVFIMYKVTHYNPNVLEQEWLLTLNRLRRRGQGGQLDLPLWFFQKRIF